MRTRGFGLGLGISAALALGLSGCGGSKCDSGSCVQGEDLAMSSTGGDMAVSSMPDLAPTPPDMTVPTFLTVDWSLISANIQGGTNNGFAEKCDAAGVTELQLTLVDENTAASKTTTVPCLSGVDTGTSAISLPSAPGPYTLSGSAVGKAMSASEKVKGVTAGGTRPSLRIYIEGCDSPACQ